MPATPSLKPTPRPEKGPPWLTSGAAGAGADAAAAAGTAGVAKASSAEELLLEEVVGIARLACTAGLGLEAWADAAIEAQAKTARVPRVGRKPCNFKEFPSFLICGFRRISGLFAFTSNNAIRSYTGPGATVRRERLN